jgi:hypothetical protein
MLNNNYKPEKKSFKNTFCVFQEVPASIIDKTIPNYKSVSGSHYFYTKEGMYRYATHWGRLAHSKWRLVEMEVKSLSKTKLGFASWSSFYTDNNTDFLYYLQFDLAQKTIQYEHKNNVLYNHKAILRTTPETTKRIKQARNILNLTNWAKHFSQNIEELRVLIVTDLVYTNLSLEAIKLKYLD